MTAFAGASFGPALRHGRYMRRLEEPRARIENAFLRSPSPRLALPVSRVLLSLVQSPALLSLVFPREILVHGPC